MDHPITDWPGGVRRACALGLAAYVLNALLSVVAVNIQPRMGIPFLPLGLGSLLALVIPALVFSRYRGISFVLLPPAPFTVRDLSRIVAASILLFLFCISLGSFLFEVASRFQEVSPRGHLPEPQSPLDLALFLIGMALFPALGEEILFRGTIFHMIPRSRPVFAVLLSAVLFSLFHSNVVHFVTAFIQGVFAGVLCLRFSCLAAPFLWHLTNNALGGLMRFGLHAFVPAGLVVSPVLAIILGTGFLWLTRDYFRELWEKWPEKSDWALFLGSFWNIPFVLLASGSMVIAGLSFGP